MTSVLIRMLVIVALGTGTGLGYNAAFGKKPWVPAQKQLETESKDLERAVKVRDDQDELRRRGISMERMLELIEQGAIVIDARTPQKFEEGHLEAPTIINIHPELIFEEMDRLSPDIVLERPIVIYCNSEECDLAELVFMELRDSYGYAAEPEGTPGVVQMFIYFAGWEGITEAGLATVAGEESWTDPWDALDEESMEEPAEDVGQASDDGGG